MRWHYAPSCRLALVRLVLVSAETEGVTGRVEEYSDVLLRLGRSDRGSWSDRLSDRGIEVPDLEVEVHHRTLFPVHRRHARRLSHVPARVQGCAHMPRITRYVTSPYSVGSASRRADDRAFRGTLRM